MAKTSFTRKLGDIICKRLAEGESLRKICDSDDMPGKATVCTWLISTAPIYKDFQDQYARAREIQRHLIEDECLDIADDGSNDWMERELPSGETIDVVNHEHVTRSRLRLDTRKWMLGRMESKRPEDAQRAPQQIILEVDKKPER